MLRTFRPVTPPRPPKKEPPATLAVSWLNDDQHGSEVLATARNLIAVENATKNTLPAALAGVCRVARIDRQEITLAVPSAAYASKLRQLAPRILLHLNSSGWNLNEISVKVQVSLLQTETKETPRQVEPLGEQALSAFAELQSKLRPGPLADAIQQLLSHHKEQ